MKGSINKFTAGIYDFKNQRIMHYEEYEVSHPVHVTFATGGHIDGLAFCVYAGVAGETQGQELFMENFEVWVDEL